MVEGFLFQQGLPGETSTNYEMPVFNGVQIKMKRNLFENTGCQSWNPFSLQGQVLAAFWEMIPQMVSECVI